MSNLFRKKAVESYKEQFSTDRQIKSLPLPLLLLMSLFFIGFFLLCIWCIFGNISKSVEVTGVVYPNGGIIKIISEQDGKLETVLAKKGDDIELNEVIAVIPQNDILDNINLAEGREKEELRKQYNEKSIIHSNVSGKIIYIADEGSVIEKGDIIATIAYNKKEINNKQILAFLPTEMKNSVYKGCQVQVSPNYASREKYGYINGYVQKVENSVITKNEAEKYYDIYNIPNLIQEDKTYVAVYINLISDESTESGLNWSNKNSGNIDVEMGATCKGEIIISEQPPYKWLFGGGVLE